MAFRIVDLPVPLVPTTMLELQPHNDWGVCTVTKEIHCKRIARAGHSTKHLRLQTLRTLSWLEFNIRIRQEVV
jgi:hypothetical protein